MFAELVSLLLEDGRRDCRWDRPGIGRTAKGYESDEKGQEEMKLVVYGMFPNAL